MTVSRKLIFVCVAAALVVAGAFLGSYAAYLTGLMAISAVAAVGLNLLVGNSGQISLCHSSFMAVGAYASSWLTSSLGMPFLLSILAGAALAAVVAALLALPARRLSGIYLALATLGFLQIVQVLVEELADYTGGVRGLQVAKPALWSAPLSEYAIYCVVVLTAVSMVWMAANIRGSRVGREFDAVRLSPHAAQALGVSVSRIKVAAFALSAFYAGVAGGLFSILVGFIEPAEFGVSASLRQLTYIVIGGLGSVTGAVLGSVVLCGLPELLRPVKEYTDLAYASILIATLMFLPRGLAAFVLQVRQRCGLPLQQRKP